MTISVRLAIAFALLLCVGGFGLAASITTFAIVDAVNAKLPTNQQFDYFRWWLPKTLRLHSEYRRLYPGGRLLRREGVLVAVMLFCTLLAGALIGLGFPLIALGGGGALWLWLIYFRKPPTM
jgi:hypothetical protein